MDVHPIDKTKFININRDLRIKHGLDPGCYVPPQPIKLIIRNGVKPVIRKIGSLSTR